MHRTPWMLCSLKNRIAHRGAFVKKKWAFDENDGRIDRGDSFVKYREAGGNADEKMGNVSVDDLSVCVRDLRAGGSKTDEWAC